MSEPTGKRTLAAHTVTDVGEMTEHWPLYQPGFLGTVRQLSCCARCGKELKPGCKTPRHTFHVLKRTMHFLCDDCFDALPD